MADSFGPVLCGGCGAVLAENRKLSPAERAPCPRCGSKARRSSVAPRVLAAALTAIGAESLSTGASRVRAEIRRRLPFASSK